MPFYYGLSMYGAVGAIASAEVGADSDICEPGYWPFYEWGSGLGRVDREATFSAFPSVSTRTGILRRFLLRFGDLAGFNPPGTAESARRENLFPTMEAVQQVLYEELAKYSTRKIVNGVQYGKITFRLNAPLEKVTLNRKGDAIASVTCGGQVYSYINYVDCTPELDLARMHGGISMRLGRESRDLSGEVTAGNRKETAVGGIRAYDLTTGQRLKPLECAPRETIHDGDARTMAFNQRIIVTQDAGRIQWADLGGDLPWYNPADYDIDFAIAFANKYYDLPGSPSPDPMRPVGAFQEYDMNNGGGLPIGSNWPGRLFEWHYATHERRRYLHALYTQNKAGLFYDICTNPRWLTIPRRIVKDANGVVISDQQIVEETAKWGLVPGRFTYPAWQANAAYTVGTRKYKKPYIYEVTKAGTTGTVGPSGDGTGIADGSVIWKMYLPFVPGMSPHIYVRESFRIVGQVDLTFDDMQPPEKEVKEAICAYAYPHMDGHIVQRFAASTGLVMHEGNDDLEGANPPVAQLMPWGACKTLPGECRNLSVVCGVSATRLGWIPSRVEFAYMKIANGLGVINGIADVLGIYSNDVDYETQAKAALVKAEMYVALPKAA